MSDYLAQLKGKPTPFDGDGFRVMLRPLLFRERQDIIRVIKEDQDKAGFDLDRKLVALTLVGDDGNPLLTEDAVNDAVAAEIASAIAREVVYRAGLAKRPDEKKALPPSTSTTPETTLGASSPSSGT